MSPDIEFFKTWQQNPYIVNTILFLQVATTLDIYYRLFTKKATFKEIGYFTIIISTIISLWIIYSFISGI